MDGERELRSELIYLGKSNQEIIKALKKRFLLRRSVRRFVEKNISGREGKSLAT